MKILLDDTNNQKTRDHHGRHVDNLKCLHGVVLPAASDLKDGGFPGFSAPNAGASAGF